MTTAVQDWKALDLEWKRLRRIERAARMFKAVHHPDCPASKWTPESRTLRICHCGFESLREALAAP